MSSRTLRDWCKAAARDAEKRLGRPPIDGSSRWYALLLVRRALRDLGWSVGEEVVCRALSGKVSLYLVRECLKVLKARHDRRVEARRKRDRVSVEVTCRDAVWAVDGTHLGRDEGAVVEGQTLKDLGSTKILDMAVGPAATTDIAIAQLERVGAERGGMPLVVVSDNGPAYTSKVFAAFLARHGVTHLKTEPHTPQHNGACECANGEVKVDAGLGKGVEVTAVDAAVITELSRLRVNRRPRPSCEWDSADDYDRRLRPWYPAVSRELFRTRVREEIEQATAGAPNARARRRAEREAILRTLECFGLIKRTRGGKPVSDRKPEVIT